LSNNNYQPRLADDRVGYFLTAYQDLSTDDSNDHFMHYVNRWNLEKQDPNAEISPPKKPIVFRLIMPSLLNIVMLLKKGY
jgi:hypothetical protein